MRRLRIGIGRLNQETNALSPILTTMADFERFHYVRGDALQRAVTWGETEIRGFVKNAEISGFVRAAKAVANADVEIVPLVSAWAIASGRLEKPTYDTISDHFADAIKKAGPLDGVFLSLHGAMGVDGVADAEADFVGRMRDVVGKTPIGASFDLHGNTTRARMDLLDVVCAYRTNPHRDHAATGARAAKLLVGELTGSIKLQTAWRSLPMMLGGGVQMDFLSPLRGIYKRMREWERRGGLDASLFTVHPWNAHPELGWSVVTHTDGDLREAEAFADELADRCWAERHQMPPEFPSAEEAIAIAKKSRVARALGVVTMADASDVVTAGGMGENTELLKALATRAPELTSYVPIRDAEVIEQLWNEPVGSRHAVRVGGKFAPSWCAPFEEDMRIRSKHDTEVFGRVIVLDIGGVRLCVTEGAPAVIMPPFYKDLGLEPWAADVIVVKNFFPFRMYFLPYSRKTLYVKTRGVTDWDAAFGLDFAGPIHPRDPVAEWRTTDARRRGATQS